MKHEAPKAKRAVADVRRSEKHPYFSIGRQRAAIRKYAKQRGLEIIWTYSDGAKGGGKQ